MTSTDPHTSLGNTPKPWRATVPQRISPTEGRSYSAGETHRAPGAERARDSRTGRTRGLGSAGREAHTKRQPGQPEQAPPVRFVTPDHPPTRVLAPDPHTETHTPPARPGTPPRRAPPGPAARARGAHQLQAAEGDQRAAPAALAHGSGGRARRSPRRPSSSAASASSQLGAPGGGAGRLGPGPGAPGPQGCGRPLALGVHGQSARAPALPRLLCLAGRPPGAPPALGRLAGSAERGAQAPRAAQRRAALPSRGSRPGARRPRLPGPTTWLRRREVGKEGKTGGKRRGGEGWGGAAEQAEGGEKGEGSAEQRREAGVKWEECRLED